MSTYLKWFFGGLAFWAMLFFAGQHMYAQTDYLRKDVSRDATLVQAYEYDDRCGHKGRYNCSAYKGRFLVEPEHVYVTQEIDGFFYHRYVDKGRVDMPSYVSVNKLDLGAKEPKWTTFWGILKFIGCAGFFMWIFGSILCWLLEESDRRDVRSYGRSRF